MVKFPNISPNLLLGVGGIIAVVFLVNQLRKAGAEVTETLERVSPVGQIDIISQRFKDFFANIKLPTFDLGIPTSDLSQLAGQTIPTGELGSTITIPLDTTVDPVTGVVTSDTPPLLNLSDIEREEALRALQEGRERSRIANEKAIADRLAEEERFRPAPDQPQFTGRESDRALFEAGLVDQFGRPIPQQQISVDVPISDPTIPQIPADEINRFDVTSQLPADQEFGFGGPSFIGGVVRENPIDTLTEVLDNFPGLTASQAADFLEATGGRILPSQVEQGLIDPDIRNIVAGFVGGGLGQDEPVSQTPLEILTIREAENLKAARTSCELFGLNCDLL